MNEMNALSHASRRGKLLPSLPEHVETNYIVLTLQFASSEVGCGGRAEQNRKREKS